MDRDSSHVEYFRLGSFELVRSTGSFGYIRCVLGHSKGALVIKNALDGLTSDMTKRLHVVTFGCAIDEAGPKVASYRQILGRLDWLGWLNSWGNPPDTQIISHHSTNTWIPLSMPVTELASEGIRTR